MADLLHLVVAGIATGAIYALAALGFTLLWQAAGVINFAQGEFVMLPAFAMLIAMTFGAPLWLAFVFACAIAMAVIGFGFKRAVVDPLIRYGVIPLVIATMGLSIGIKNATKAGYSAQAFPFPSAFPVGQLSLAGVTVSYADIGTLIFAGAIVVGLQAFLNRTVTGRAMQAVAQNADAARVLGIDVRRMVLYTFLINAVLAAVAALLIAPSYLAKFDMGDSIGQKAFFAAIIGGFNQTRGALLGGVLIGVLENVVGFYVSPAYKEGVALVLFLAVILFRPEGLLGRAEERKV
jgi:branched-chain amino acid transport system permease protein